MTFTYWTCEGSVRGECGKRHRSEDAAAAHCREDGRAVKRGHGSSAYSDRRPVERDVPPKPGTATTIKLAVAQAKVADADQYLSQARAERDALVREAIAEGLSMYRIAQATGLSQATIALIRR